MRAAEHIRSNVVGYVAVFLALAGGAGALPGRETVNSGDIKNRAVHSSDLDRGAVTSRTIRARAIRGQHFPDVVITSRMISDSTFQEGDIARAGKKLGDKPGDFHIAGNAIQTGEVSNASLTGSDVASNSLTGSDIDEGSLGLGSSYAERTGSLGLTTSFQTVVSRSITTTAAAQLSVFASVRMGPDAIADGTYNANCMIEVDGLYRSPEYSQDSGEFNFGSFAIAFGRTVFPGGHTVALRCEKQRSPGTFVIGGMTVIAAPLA